jgi:tetratricopeptide (TPR) repeat protein
MRSSHVPTILACAVLAAALLPAQGTAPKGGPPGGTTGGNTGSTNTGTLPGVPTRGNTPGNTLPNSTNNPDAISRGTFFYGKVAMSDGSTPPSQIVIERVCGGSVRPQAYTDSHGNFSFQSGQTQDMIPDATVSRSSNAGLNPTGSNTSSQSNTTFSNCDLRASLPGFRSDVISLAGRHSLDDPNVGTIFLHRLANVEGLTTSATSSLASKDAHKAFDKGLEAVKKSKIDEAQADFLKATELYPRYAAAWFELGRVYEQREHIAEARDAYAKSIAADSKYVNPYEHLYVLSIKENNWEDVAATTERIMRLNPYDFPMAVYYNAVANLQLKKLDIAEKSAREALAMQTKGDSAAQNPKINYVLGVILIQKEDYKGAADCLKTYLKSDGITDKDRVTKMLADIEKQVEAKADVKPEP